MSTNLLESFVESTIAGAAKYVVLLPGSGSVPLHTAKCDKATPKTGPIKKVMEDLLGAIDRDRACRNGDVSYVIMAFDPNGDHLSSHTENRKGTAAGVNGNVLDLAANTIKTALENLPKMIDACGAMIETNRAAMSLSHERVMEHNRTLVDENKNIWMMVRDHREIEDALAKRLTVANAHLEGDGAASKLKELELKINGAKDMAVGLLGPAIPVLSELAKEWLARLGHKEDAGAHRTNGSNVVRQISSGNSEPQKFYSREVADFRKTMGGLDEAQIIKMMAAFMDPSTHGGVEERDRVLVAVSRQAGADMDKICDSILAMIHPREAAADKAASPKGTAQA